MDDNQTPNPWQAPQTHDPMRQPEPHQTDDYLPVTFQSTMTVAKKLWNEHRPTLLAAWGIPAATWLAVSLLLAVIRPVAGVDLFRDHALKSMHAHGGPFAAFSALGTGYWIFLGITMVLGIFLAGIGVASFAPIRRAYFEGINLSGGEVLSELLGRAGSGIALYLIFIIAFVLGSFLCCIPGLAVGFFMLPTFYLVGGRGDGVTDSLSTGFDWAKKHFVLLLILLGVGVGMVVVMACPAGVASQLMMRMGKVGYMLRQLISWFFGAFLGFFAWLLYASMMITIDQAEDHGMNW